MRLRLDIVKKHNSFIGKKYDKLINSVTCCRTCNVAKVSLTKQDFFNWIKRVYLFQGFKND